MTTHEEALLVDRVSAEVAAAFRPRLREIERESDRLLGELRSMRRRHLADVERLTREAEEARAEAGRQTRRAAEFEALLAEATQPTLSVEGAGAAA